MKNKRGAKDGRGLISITPDSEEILKINSYLTGEKVSLVILDGFYGMEGEGPFKDHQ